MKQKRKGIFDMSSKRITERDFFTCEAEELAKKLIGKIICHEDFDGKEKFVIKARITATEAYRKVDSCLDDNRTQKTTSQSLAGGHLHFHNAGNGRRRIDIVANEVGVSESVLIAGVDMYDGPSKTLWILDIDDPQYDGLDLLSPDSKIWIEDDGTIAELNNATQRKNISDTTPLRFTAKIFKFR